MPLHTFIESNLPGQVKNRVEGDQAVGNYKSNNILEVVKYQLSINESKTS